MDTMSHLSGLQFFDVVNAGALLGRHFQPFGVGVCLGAGVLGLQVTGFFLALPDFSPKWLPPLRPSLHLKLRREKMLASFSISLLGLNFASLARAPLSSV